MDNDSMSMKDARQIAVTALCKMDDKASWSNLVLEGMYGDLDERGRALASALFYGVLSRKITLDACIAAHSKIPVWKIDSSVRIILRCALYQILHMDSIPEHAAIDSAVTLTRKMRKASASGFVNAVLRSFLRGGKNIPATELHVEYSCDAKLAQILVDTYGEETARVILADSLEPPPTFLRVNKLKTTDTEMINLLWKRGVEAHFDDKLLHCLVTRSAGALHSLPEFTQGLCHVQDRSSQLCANMLAAKPGERVLDVCAAPGGKSFVLAQTMRNTGDLVCCDLHEHRIRLIEKRMQELGITNIRTLVFNMSEPHPELGFFDKVLCDVPCSGYGVMRRRPEIKYKSPANFADLPALQYKLLETSSNYCKQGALLLYSTCTLNPDENDAVADKFLAGNPGFTQLMRKLTMPGEHGGDGFFTALFEKTMRG
jgi:16S rRNA (cytosine967-C5)-methyltransferase